MKNLEITESCFVKGQPVEVGDIIENVDNSVAAQLLTSGRAKIAEIQKAAPKKKAAKKASKKAAKKVDADSDSK